MKRTDTPEGVKNVKNPENPENPKSAVIAGEGILPVEIAKRLTAGGRAPLVLALRDDTEAFLGIADPLVRLRCPGLSRVLA